MFWQTLAMSAPPAGDEGGSGLMGFMPILFVVAIFYFLIMRPQQRREKERKALVAALKSGERVLLSSGIIGEIVTVKERTMIVRIAENTQVEVLRSAVTQVIEEGETPDEVKA